MTLRLKRCKSVEECQHQVRWFSQRPSTDVPLVLDVDGDSYTYQWIEGECPVSLDYVGKLIEFCRVRLWDWGREEMLPINAGTYGWHLWGISKNLNPSDKTIYLDWFKRQLNRCHFTPVRACHGDLTLENVVRVNGRFVFLDPGFDRGLPCQENDLAKIAQSQEEMGIESTLINTIETRVLLASHYLRLLRHPHPEKRLEHARKRLNELTNE